MYGQNSASALRKKLLTLEMRGGVHVQHVPSDTMRYSSCLISNRWWTDEDFDDHKSHVVNYQSSGLISLTDTQHALASWPEIGAERAKAVSKVFRTVRLAANAAPTDWANVQTIDKQGGLRRIGEKTAQKIITFLTGGH